MKSMYHEKYYSYLPSAVALDTEVSDILLPVFEKYIDKGYSPREISQVIQVAVGVVECDIIIGLTKNKNENKKKHKL